ncbi:MAG: phosphate signaling complex protein PhoU [Sedimentisphaerales bacterium]|nr:phosphate signaling complex protein PhoU [Sedimentisphaerales bacterium]
MAIHLQREIDNLKKKILNLGALVESRVRKATLSIQNRNPDLARDVIETDLEIDYVEVDVEEECLKILALHQPVAVDLRFIIAVLKINNDLERIGDLAVNIAERALYLVSQPPLGVSLDFVGMARRVQRMLKNSLDALVNFSASLAKEVCLDDDEVDAMNRQMYLSVQQGIRSQPQRVEPLIHMLSVSRHLERIADHATNIAEDVIYMVEGEIVRHKTEEYM